LLIEQAPIRVFQSAILNQQSAMYLGIEIGGTKLQLGVGDGEKPELAALERLDIDAKHGATGILDQIQRAAPGLIRRHSVSRIGIGFGGPVDSASGTVLKSHQVPGWDNIPLLKWCRETFEVPAVIGNDCDVAALAEARYGAGKDAGSVFYVTIGTGVGGGYVVDGKLHGAGRPAVAEIGHLRPGLHDDRPELTVESLCSGWGIAASAQTHITGQVSRSLDVLRRVGVGGTQAQIQSRLALAEETHREYVQDLLNRCNNDPEQLTAKIVAQAAAEGNEVARDVLDHAAQVLGWAIAQMITLLAPEVVVLGGGVSLIGEQLFLGPVRQYVARYVFPPLASSYRLAPAALGELAVVHGAVAIAAMLTSA
jgi:glucokinase